MLKCVENCGPRHPPKTRLGSAVKKCSSSFYTYKFFLRNQIKKIYNRAKELYCDATIFVCPFFIVYLSKKMETEKWPKAADSLLSQLSGNAYGRSSFPCQLPENSSPTTELPFTRLAFGSACLRGPSQ